MASIAEDELLLVEDNPADIELFKHALSESDFEGTLRTATTGTQALQVLQEEAMDLAILDINLPGKSGIEVLAELNDESEVGSTPILIFSSSDDPKQIRKAYELGASAYIVKRMDFEDTVSLVKTLQEFWLNAAELPD
ncbi:response regulator [Haloarcula amylovorans]|uniref:response regulator n=1 Tax=Haloarcula amylovorans TaxID=2562280 RepID=UPI00142FF1C9|nr:response regulator [Halomicroarcula amylolytica]